MSALKSLMLTAALALGGCFYPTTFYRATADEGAYPRNGCPGREEYWIFKKTKIELQTKVIPREQFELFMWFRTTEPTSTNLMNTHLVSAGKTYEPSAIEKRVYKSCSPFCGPDVERNPSTENLGSSLYVALFPKEIEKLSEFKIHFPPLVVQGMRVNL